MREPKFLGLLPARGGSKGIPGKNLRPLNGRPLIAWAAKALCGCPEVHRRVCSTDDGAIAEAARACGLDTPFARPAELACDETPVVDVIRHALDELDDPAEPYTHVVLVQATSPTVRSEDISNAIRLTRESEADTIITGYMHKGVHPAIMFMQDTESGRVDWIMKNGEYAMRRQDVPQVFVRTGLFYVISAENIRNRGSIYGERVHAVIVDESRAVAIDVEEDFRRAEYLLEQYT